MEIKRLDPQHIQPHMTEAKSEGLVFCTKTEYFGLYDGDLLLGFTGILYYKTKAVFKNHFVFKAHRRRGHFKTMFTFSLGQVINKGLTTIEATCTKDSIDHYLKFGFTPIKYYKEFTKVKYENLH